MTGKSINTCTDLADQSDLSEPASAMQRWLASGLQTDLQPAENHRLREWTTLTSRLTNDLSNLQTFHIDSAQQLLEVQTSQTIQKRRGRKQNEKNASLFFFLSYHAARPSRGVQTSLALCKDTFTAEIGPGLLSTWTHTSQLCRRQSEEKEV